MSIDTIFELENPLWRVLPASTAGLGPRGLSGGLPGGWLVGTLPGTVIAESLRLVGMVGANVLQVSNCEAPVPDAAGGAVAGLAAC